MATLPINLKYKDKIDLANKLLHLYSALVTKLTEREVSLLTICLLEDMNSSKFRKIVENHLGVKYGNVNTALSRLRNRKFINKDDLYRKDSLSVELSKLKELIGDTNPNKEIKLTFLK